MLSQMLLNKIISDRLKKILKPQSTFLKKHIGIQALACAYAKTFFGWRFDGKVKKRLLSQIWGTKKITLIDILLLRYNYSVTTTLILHPLLITMLWNYALISSVELNW